MQREMLALQLERVRLIDTQIAKLNGLIAQTMKPHQDAVMRLAEVPGLGVDSAQQIIAEVGVQASTFSSAAELTSWVGTCPGKDESAEQNHSSRSAKGNKYLRRLLPRLGYQSAIWAVAHRLCRVVWKILHDGVRFIEYSIEPDPQAEATCPEAGASPSQARLRGRNLTHKPCYCRKRSANVEEIFDGVRC